MKRLILTVGLPRSGKTTWARKQGFPIVSPDAIRLVLHGARFSAAAEPMVWVIARYMVEALFAAGHDEVIVDATNATIQRRAEWVNETRWQTDLCVIPTSAGVCRARAMALRDFEILPVIDRMAAAWDLSTPLDGDPDA